MTAPHTPPATVPLTELASVIRSKNSGPFELTLDIMFKQETDYLFLKNSGVFAPGLFASLYGVEPDQVLRVIHFDPACAVKATMVRPVPSGGPGDTDVYGAQQHAPLLGLQVPAPPTVPEAHPPHGPAREQGKGQACR